MGQDEKKDLKEIFPLIDTDAMIRAKHAFLRAEVAHSDEMHRSQQQFIADITKHVDLSVQDSWPENSPYYHALRSLDQNYPEAQRQRAMIDRLLQKFDI